MQTTRLIKKYANRRLYDTEQSIYITLENLKQLIIDGISVKIIEAKSKQDVTRSCLIQIILEQEDSGIAVFSVEALENIIRFYGNPMQQQLILFFNEALNNFFKQQHNLQQAFTAKSPEQMLALMTSLTATNMAKWQDFMQNFLSRPPTKN